MGLNDLKVEVYSSGTTRIYDSNNELSLAEGIRFSTIYPGGLYGDCSLRIPRDVANWWEMNGAQRLVVRNGLQIVWEGKIDNLVSALNESSSSVDVKAIGMWGTILGRRRWNKPWCEMRIDENVWVWNTATGSNRVPDFCTLDRNERIRFTPKNVAWSNNNYVSIYYNAPTGETIKRVTFDYDLQEGGQAWALALTDAALTFPWPWSVTASGTGSADTTFGTPTTRAYIAFVAQAGQTPTEDGTYYGQISNVKVYTETGSINLTEVAKDCRAKITDLNTTDVYIGSNTFALEPFITEGYEEISSILERAAAFGDSSYNRWACYADHSDMAPAIDGKPVLVVEQQPALTDYDYRIRLEEIDPDFSFDRYFDELWNWIIVKYKDANGKDTWLTPDDDATLTNATSTATYGQRDYVLDAGEGNATTAANIGRTFLAEHKDPKYRMSGAINVKGSIRAKGGNLVPASQIRAGKRVRIENFLQDLSGTGLTFLIAQTDYEADGEVCAISAGSDLVSELKMISG
jgi:hypothetical protein